MARNAIRLPNHDVRPHVPCRDCGVEAAAGSQRLSQRVRDLQMHGAAVQGVFGQYGEPVLTLMPVLRRFGEDAADDEFYVVVRLQDVVPWVIKVDHRPIEHSQVAALFNVAGGGVPEVDVAAE